MSLLDIFQSDESNSTDPIPEVANLGNQFSGGVIDRVELLETAEEMNLRDRLTEGVRNKTINWRELVYDSTIEQVGEEGAYQIALDVTKPKDPDSPYHMPFFGELTERANASRRGTYAPTSKPLTDVVAKMIKTFPSFGPEDIPVKGGNSMTDSNNDNNDNDNNDNGSIVSLISPKILVAGLAVSVIVIGGVGR